MLYVFKAWRFKEICTNYLLYGFCGLYYYVVHGSLDKQTADVNQYALEFCSYVYTIQFKPKK